MLIRLIFFILISFFTNDLLANDYQLKLRKGKEYKLKISYKTQVRANTESKNQQKMDLHCMALNFKVKNVNTDSYDIQLMTDSLVFSVYDSLSNTNLISTSRNSTGEIMEIVSIIENTPISLELTKYGKVKSLKNINLLWEKIDDYLKDKGALNIYFLADFFESFYSTENLTKIIDFHTNIFPSEGLKTDKSWTKNYSLLLSGVIPVMIENKYHIDEITKKEFVISSVGSFRSPVTEAPDENQTVVTIQYEAEGKIKAEYKINKKTRWVNSSIIDMNGNGSTFYYMFKKKVDSPFIIDSKYNSHI